MKFRTDFVTNSSSSSYCVTLSVKTADGKYIEFNPCPEDSDEYPSFSLRTSAETLPARIKECRDMAELSKLLLGEIDISQLEGQFEWGDEEEFEDDDWYDDEDRPLSPDVKFELFKAELEAISDISSVKSVTISEIYSGWGEFASDGIESFLDNAASNVVDWKDEKAVHAALKGKFSEDTIDEMIEQKRESYICVFEGWIDTEVRLSDGTVTKSYGFVDKG